MGRLRTVGRARRDAPKHLARLAPRQYRPTWKVEEGERVGDGRILRLAPRLHAPGREASGQGQGDREGAGLPRDDGPDGVAEAEDDEAPRRGELARSVSKSLAPHAKRMSCSRWILGRPARTDQAAIGKSLTSFRSTSAA